VSLASLLETALSLILLAMFFLALVEKRKLK
jgi:hypothetical protein